MDEKLKPVSPGELLLEEFLLPMGITRYRLAKEIGVPAQRIGEIVAGRRTITADTDLRLCRFFGLSNGYWLRAQAAHDTEIAEEALADQLSYQAMVRDRCLRVGGLSDKRIKLVRRSAGGLTGGRRARSLSAVRSTEKRTLVCKQTGLET